MTRRALSASLIFLAHGFALNAATTAANDLPAAMPLSRYDALMKKSPFALATPAGATAAASTAGFTANLYVSGVAKIDGRDFVTIRSKDGQTHFSLMPGELGPDGIVITSVDWSDEVGKSKVTLKKGQETGVAEFDQAVLQAPPPPAAVANESPQNGPQPGRGWGGREQRFREQAQGAAQGYQRNPNFNYNQPRPSGSAYSGGQMTPQMQERHRTRIIYAAPQ